MLPHSPEFEIDPVCGMRVRLDKAKFQARHVEKDYYFCAAACRDKFNNNPDLYIKKKGGFDEMPGLDPFALPAATAAPAKSPPAAPPPRSGKKGLWYCPMCEGVLSDKPGDCPRCGMALELAPGNAAEITNSEYHELKVKFIEALLPALIVIYLGMSVMFHQGSAATAGGANIANYVQLALTGLIIFWPGWFVLRRGFAGVKSLQFNMFTLISVGVLSAFGYSAAGTLFPAWFPESVKHDGIVHMLYYDSAASILLIVIIGQMLESRSRGRASSAIRELVRFRPAVATRIRQGREESVAVEQLATGDLIRVRPGERVPADGNITEGAASIDESALTGEPIPVDRKITDTVSEGTLAVAGSIVMRATRTGESTILSKLIESAEIAQREKPALARLADRVTQWFVPVVTAIAILTFAAWLRYGPEPAFIFAMVHSVSVFIVACPCALGLATPMAILVASGRAARTGILIRGAGAFERAAKVNKLVIDKTGTLTEGRPVVRAVFAAPGVGESELIERAAAVERWSEHPIARAIVNYAETRNVERAAADHFQAFVGEGAIARINGVNISIGSLQFASREGAAFAELEAETSKAAADGGTVIFVAAGSRALGAIHLADAVRAGAREAIRKLKKMNIHIVMATGDDERAARAVARELDITDVRARVMPEDKLRIVKEARASGLIVAMAGDGLNDLPALAAADVGIAMGRGSDAAMESAPLILLNSDIGAIAGLFQLARATQSIILQNLFWAFCYNIITIPAAAGAGALVAGISGAGDPLKFILSPAWAAVAMVMSSLLVVLNSLRLARRR